MTISSKVAAAISLVVALTGALFVVIALRGQEREQQAQFTASNVEALELLALAVAPAVAEGRHHRAQAVLDNVANYPERFPDVVALEVLDRDGRVVADLDPRRYNMRADDAQLADDLALREPSLRREDGTLVIAIPLRLAHPIGVMRAEVSEARLAEAIASQQQGAALLVVAAMLTTGLAIYLLHRKLVTARLEALAGAVARLRAGNMDVRTAAFGNDELAELGRGFNDMAEELARYTQELEARVAARTEELEGANAKLQKLATTDQLTALYNRRYFEEQVEQQLKIALRSDRPLSLVLVDIDHFKSINDRFGHPTGDRVLKHVARALKRSARETDIVARIGGEEFAIAMPDADSAQATTAAERMRRALADSPITSAPVLEDERVNGSFGIACSPDHGDHLSMLLRAADTALYDAKHQGRNRVCIAAGRPPPSVPPPPGPAPDSVVPSAPLAPSLKELDEEEGSTPAEEA